MATIPPEVLQRISYSTYGDVWNRKKPEVIDRAALPWNAFIQKRKKTSGMAGANGTTVKLKKDGGFTLQFWERRDVLTFIEPSIELELVFPFTNCHSGYEVVHEDLFRMGYYVKPNDKRGKNMASRLSDDEANILVDYFDETIEEMMDAYDRNMELAFLRDGSYDTKAPVGLDGMINTTPTTGTIGGKSRSNTLLQHTVALGLTSVASGNMRLKMTQTRRAANTYSRERLGGSGVDFLMCGSGFLDAYVGFCTANNFQYQWTPNKPLSTIDIGIPETGYQFEGMPLVWNPNFDKLDTIESPSQTWTKRCYMLNSKSWVFGYMKGMDKEFSAPMDPSDQRVSRLSLDGRYGLICISPNANALVTAA